MADDGLQLRTKRLKQEVDAFYAADILPEVLGRIAAEEGDLSFEQ